MIPVVARSSTCPLFWKCSYLGVFVGAGPRAVCCPCGVRHGDGIAVVGNLHQAPPARATRRRRCEALRTQQCPAADAEAVRQQWARGTQELHETERGGEG